MTTDDLKALLGILLFAAIIGGFVWGLLVSAEKPKHLSE